MKIPLLNQAKKARAKFDEARSKRRNIPTPDQARIQRELDYMKRIGTRNPRLKRLQNKIDSQKRRSYGR